MDNSGNACSDDQQKSEDGKDDKIDNAHAQEADQDDGQTKDQTAFQNFDHKQTSLLFVTVHKGTEINKHGFIRLRKISFKIKKVFDIIRELITDLPVQRRRNMDRWNFTNVLEAAFIAARHGAENFHGERDPGLLDRMDKRTRTKKVSSKSVSLGHANVLRAGAVMTEDDMTELASESALEEIKREPLIIRDEIPELAVFIMDGGDGVVGFGIKGSDETIPLDSDAS